MEAAAPTGKKNYLGWIILAVVLLILFAIGVIYYYNKDFLNKATAAPASNAGVKPGVLGSQPIKDGGGLQLKK